MKITTYGTRGSVPVAGAKFAKYGGNTTSLQIRSDCLPPNYRLVIDAGTGFVPFSTDLILEMGQTLISKEVTVNLLLTHLHHDHNQGLPLSPLTFISQVEMRLFGPVEHGIGPRKMMEALMSPPFFPVSFKQVGHHFSFKELEFPSAYVIVFHPVGGSKVLTVEQFERMETKGHHVPVGKDGRYPISECLVIRMYKSNHPEQTISYRFEERPTGRVFVFLTDHENQDGIPTGLRKHLAGANLLIADAQYPQKQYEQQTAGFGHGTGPYCARLAFECRVEKVGLTHHNPFADDTTVEAVLTEATTTWENLSEKKGDNQSIFACADYQTIEV